MSISNLFTTDAGAAWRRFDEICRIPRASGEEGPIRDWLLQTAAANNWGTQMDAVGNVVLQVPGKGTLADCPPLILQGHMDMVTEQTPDSRHDFGRDPITPLIEGDWVVADGTTLGADNGVAMALALAAAEAELPERLPLELLFTVDEERGLIGASQLDAGMLTGRRLVNLDSEDDNAFVIGCAGGVDLHIDLDCEQVPAPAGEAFEIEISRLRGGHSGLNIHEGRANAILAAGDLFLHLRQLRPDCRCRRLQGGRRKNAIPRRAALVLTGVDRETVDQLAAGTRAALRETEPDAVVEVRPATPGQTALPETVFDLLANLPHGVLRHAPDAPDQVQCSNNLGLACHDHGRLQLRMHARAPLADELHRVRDDVAGLAADRNMAFQALNEFPGWESSPDSTLVRQARRVFERVNHTTPQVVSVHAGLEAGIIGDKLGMDQMLAYGPRIETPHCPAERLHIDSFARVFRFVRALVSDPLDGAPA